MKIIFLKLYMAEFRVSEFMVDVSLKPHQLHAGHLEKLEEKLQRRFEGKCHSKIGYIKKGSLRLLSREPGKLKGNHFTGNITYRVKFSCETTEPLPGSELICRINKKNPITGLLAMPVQNLPYIAMIPKSIETNEKTRALIDRLDVNSKVIVIVQQLRLVAGDRNNRQSKYMLVCRLKEEIDTHTVQLYELATPVVQFPDALMLETINNPESYDPWVKRDQYTTSEDDYVAIRDVHNKIVDLNEKADLEEDKWWLGPRATGDKTLWNTLKRYVNKYELINHRSVSPLAEFAVSRAFYKMLEMLLFPDNNLLQAKDMTMLNLAESPGGFIQALLYQRKYMKTTGQDAGGGFRDILVAASINESTTIDKPTLWQRLKDRTGTVKDKGYGMDRVNFVDLKLDEEPAINTYLPEESGHANVLLVPEEQADLLKLENLERLEQMFKARKAQLVTADGGFDVKGYETKEIEHYRLFYAEILTALLTQEDDGAFVLKIYDVLTQFTVEMLLLLSMFYNKVSLFKPHTSRQANSEKYVICTGFNSSVLTSTRIAALKNVLKQWPSEDTLVSIFPQLKDDAFTDRIKAFNSDYLQIEVQTITEGLRIGGDLLAMDDTRDIKSKLESIENIQRDNARTFLRDSLQLTPIEPK